ncbi:MAG: excinuclease ABC subunit UvrC [Vicinamibacterales bacterium]|nr:excinuclease ABC subunit UvrC [Vicinamibacterales bacterium]
MPVQNLKAQIANLPEQPGVYLFANDAGETIYIGKARSLRDRVRSYLGARGTHPKTDALLDEAAGLDVIITDSVVEALALENHLVKERAPRYNVRLRDDKNYPYLQLTTNEPFPRVLVARRVERDGTFYAGPFMPASLARRTMGLTHRLFGIRSCNEVITGIRDRPCLEYDIKRCIAPCVATVCSKERYDEAVERTQLFFEGKNEELIERLTESMRAAAEAERFEEAAHLRDASRTVQTLRDRQQKIATARLGDRDAFGLHIGPAGAVIHVFVMREGKVLERIALAANEGLSGSAAEILQASVEQFYESRPAPAEVHLSSPAEDADLLEAWLSERADRTVQVVVPKRGEKRGLVDLAVRNARVAYQARLIDTGLSNYDALETLRTTLQLTAIPRRIECFDISTIQGSETVASMVVCEDGKMRKGDYRKYRISAANHAGSDDFAAMREVVHRRYRKLLEQGGPFPDLVLIDGGKGQLTAAYDALRELGLANLVAVGIAKKEELIYLRDRDDPVAFGADDPALQLVQRIRDEAHRFAVTFHRTARKMRDLRSELDSVPGIGPRRRRALLIAFGSLAGVRRASREDLMAVVGAKTADAVLGYFTGK